MIPCITDTELSSGLPAVRAYSQVKQKGRGVKTLQITKMIEHLVSTKIYFLVFCATETVSLLAYQILVFKYILEKDTKKLTPLLEAALCPHLLCFPGLCDMLLHLIKVKCKTTCHIKCVISIWCRK
jgi:hypothetical protein